MLRNDELIAKLDDGPPFKPTGPFRFYQRSGYALVHRHLAAPDDPSKRHVEHHGQSWDLARQIVEPLRRQIATDGVRLDEHAELWRGTETRWFHDGADPASLPGKLVPQASFVSTTIFVEDATKHAQEHPGAGPLLLGIDVPPGVPLLWSAWLPAWMRRTIVTAFENEVLLPPGGALRVLDYTPGGPGPSVYQESPSVLMCRFEPPPGGFAPLDRSRPRPAFALPTPSPTRRWPRFFNR